MKLSMDQMVMDVKAAVQELAKTGLKVGVVGYCLGGTMAWLAATRIPGVAAAVGFCVSVGTPAPSSQVRCSASETDTSSADFGQGPRGAQAARPHLRGAATAPAVAARQLPGDREQARGPSPLPRAPRIAATPASSMGRPARLR
jgi:dienelactone hydrolase